MYSYTVIDGSQYGNYETNPNFSFLWTATIGVTYNGTSLVQIVSYSYNEQLRGIPFFASMVNSSGFNISEIECYPTYCYWNYADNMSMLG